MLNKILIIILTTPLSVFAQTLGTNQGDHVEIASFNGSTLNSFMNKSWLLRIQDGADWTSTRLHNGISIDNSFLTPAASSKTWWERDPYRDIQSWGNSTNTYLTINQGRVGINTMNPTTGLQLGDLGSNITSKQIMIPGVYNFERLVLGHLGNGNMAMEMVNHSGIHTSYGVRLMTNIDSGPQGLQFQYATMKDDYNLLNYQTAMFMGVAGNIGIGTITPLSRLSVAHKEGYGQVANFSSKLEDEKVAIGVENSGFSWIGTTSNHHFQIYANNDPKLTVLASGNIGIGTATPSDPLSVNGKIRAREIKVENDHWPDYVFSKSYPLPSLQQTEQHIKEKGHLPGIPSAAEVKTNGIDLGEMNAKLLQKIEELTLHLIEKNKQIEIINERNKNYEIRLEKLEKRK